MGKKSAPAPPDPMIAYRAQMAAQAAEKERIQGERNADAESNRVVGMLHTLHDGRHRAGKKTRTEHDEDRGALAVTHPERARPRTPASSEQMRPTRAASAR